MDVEDTQNEISASSVSLDPTDPPQNEVISPEDLAWVDSCLIKDYDISESDWIPLRDALLDIISSQPQSFSTEGENNDFLPSSIHIVLTQDESSTYDTEHSSEPSSTYNVNSIRFLVERGADENPDNEHNVPSPFLSTYNEDLKLNDTMDLGLILDSSTYETEQAKENIFKIWDLDIQSGDGELFEQLDKALLEDHFKAFPSSFDGSQKWKEDSLDDLVAGLSDLSLK